MLRRIVTIVAAVVCVAPPVSPAAHAAEYDFRGRCAFRAVQLEGGTSDTWTGEVNVVVRASGPYPNPPEPTVTLTDVSCELVVNGESRGTVLTAPDGVGVTAAAGTLTYTANKTDDVSLCTHATVGGTPVSYCAEACTCDPGDLPPEAHYLLGVVTEALAATDPIVCGVLLRALVPLNDIAPDVLRVDPDTGDTYLFGALFLDCPPYET